MPLSQPNGVDVLDASQFHKLVAEGVWVFRHPGVTVACRPLRLDEAALAADIEATRFQPSTSVSAFEAMISGQNSCCCGVFVNDTLVGCAAANTTPALDEYPAEAFIDNISILTDHAGCGYGLLLTAYLLKVCRAPSFGCSRATLEVRVGNTPAKRIYARFGFTCHGIRKRYYSHPTEDAEIHWLENMETPAMLDVLVDAVSHALELFHVKQLQRSGEIQ